jgi:hypothetical protein
MTAKRVLSLRTHGFFFVALLLTGCGYTLQGTHSHELEKEGIHRIYLAPVRNDTYKVGVENVVYNSMLKSLGSYSGIHLVSDKDQADAVLTLTVTQADAQVAGTGSASSLNPNTIGNALPTILLPVANEYVATLYNALLAVSFKLTKVSSSPSVSSSSISSAPSTSLAQAGPRQVWAGSFSRSQIFQASNQLGSLGATSMLINESEFDRTIQGISKDMMADAREAMLARF